MRASIVAWSMVSGIAMGALADAALIGAAIVFALLLPDLRPRLNQRWFAIGAATVLAAVPIVFAVLGYFEGELKAG
jgi:hypothetical protein